MKRAHVLARGGTCICRSQLPSSAHQFRLVHRNLTRSTSKLQRSNSSSFHTSRIIQERRNPSSPSTELSAMSSDILSQTLSSITAIKLDELSNQRTDFEDGKAKLMRSVANESDQRKKLEMLLENIESIAVMGKLTDNPLISLTNAKQFLEQSGCDPSVTTSLLKDWRLKLEKELDIHSSKYEYASLYGALVNEWLDVARNARDKSAEPDASGFETVGRKEMHEQRVKWEEYVFKPLQTDTSAIDKYLQQLFTSNRQIKEAYSILRKSTADFELDMRKLVHFNVDSLKGIIEGLLRSDLVTDEKRKVLKDFLNNKVVLAEIADVLNMRMSTLDKWHWDPKGTMVEQRRQLNGRYRFYHDEDLLQSILLRYIGVQWSVHFKRALTKFQSSSEVWKSSSAPLTRLQRQQRHYFLGPVMNADSQLTVEGQRGCHFEKEIFLEQLTGSTDEKRGGYGDDVQNSKDNRKSGHEITQTLLHILATEIIMKTRLGEEINVVRTDFSWFGPSLPHSTMFQVLSFFGVSDRWVGFFRRALEAPMKFVQDGADAPILTRKRGTPISGPLSDMLGETVLFCLDLSFNQRTDGARMYRLHDDIWFWGAEKSCVKGWAAMKEFATLMGLEFNEEKTGSVKITRDGKSNQVSSSLPKGDVRWGFLKLDSKTGRFLIDQDQVDTHIDELRLQLDACNSIFDWIQAWNVYGARFFTNNFGRPANCYGKAHVDMMLGTFAHIQSKLFSSTGGSVTSTIKGMIRDRFGVAEVPEGYLHFPASFGGLDIKSPFVDLYLIRDKISKDPDSHMDKFFTDEEVAYRAKKAKFENGPVTGALSLPQSLVDTLAKKSYMPFDEYTLWREQTSMELRDAYSDLSSEPGKDLVQRTSDVSAHIDEWAWSSLSPYQQWIIQLYAPDMISRFGGLNVVDKGLLPTGMVGMFRESRFKWQG